MSTSFMLPKIYAKYSPSQAQLASNLVKKHRLSMKWPKNASILEFGFGDGTNYKISVWPNFPTEYKEYFATDISKTMIDFARNKLDRPNMIFQELAIDSSTIPNDFRNRFDLILSFFTNHLVKNPKQMFKNIHSMLKPGGQTFQITLERSPLDIVFRNLSNYPKWAKYDHDKIISQYFDVPDPSKAVESDIKYGGFEVYQLIKEPCIYEFDSKEDWQGLFLSTNPLLLNIPSEDLEEYKRDYFTEIQNNAIVFDKNVNDSDVGIVKNTLYVISATK